jgi:PiT family inorganic phosphate transporter
MVGTAVVATLVVASLAALFTAWTIGAGSSGSTPFAPAVGANAISTMRAAFVVGIVGFAGAVLQGAAVSETVGNELVVGPSLSPVAATVALLTAALLIAGGVFRGYPIATAFAVSGAVVGVGVAFGASPAWEVYGEIALFWAATPVVGVSAAYGTARLLRSDAVPAELTMPVLGAVVGVIVANMEFGLLAPPGEAASPAAVAAVRVGLPGSGLLGLAVPSAVLAALFAVVLFRGVVRDRIRAQRRFLLSMGVLVAFSAGGGKVGLAVGPLFPLFESLPTHVPIVVALTLGGVGLLLGSWMAAPRMIKALAQDYSGLGPRRSIAVLIPSFAIAQAGIFLGLPMSFNEIFVSAITGSGLAAGRDAVSSGKMAYTVLAWVLSLVASLAIGYGAYTALAAVGIT